MDNVFPGVTPLLTFLLPGFLSAWFFYAFTSYPKPSQFERTVEALVLTFVVHAATQAVQVTLETVGRFWSGGLWTSTSHVVCAVPIATALGAVMAAVVNKDVFHSWLRGKGLTPRSAHPSEWFCVLDSTPADVVLNLTDGRRLTGWPKEWPLDPSRGQFYIQDPAWIDEAGNVLSLLDLDGIIIQATDVRWVEVFVDEGDGDGIST